MSKYLFFPWGRTPFLFKLSSAAPPPTFLVRLYALNRMAVRSLPCGAPFGRCEQNCKLHTVKNTHKNTNVPACQPPQLINFFCSSHTASIKKIRADVGYKKISAASHTNARLARTATVYKNIAPPHFTHTNR